MVFGRRGGFVVGAVLAVFAWVTPARAQDPAAERVHKIYAAPGHYGMMYGTPSYGTVRAYSEFSSPRGAGYGYGYAPYRILPGAHGVGLWRPDMAAHGYVYGAGPHAYRTFPVPYTERPPVPTPPVGVYAPAFGPTYPGW